MQTGKEDKENHIKDEIFIPATPSSSFCQVASTICWHLFCTPGPFSNSVAIGTRMFGRLTGIPRTLDSQSKMPYWATLSFPLTCIYIFLGIKSIAEKNCQIIPDFKAHGITFCSQPLCCNTIILCLRLQPVVCYELF